MDHGAQLHIANVVWTEVPGQYPARFTVIGNSIAVDASGGAYQGLAEGEKFTTHFTYEVVDQNGERALQHAEITITGTNDGPIITGGAGGVSWIEDNADVAPVLTATGLLDFTDVGLSNTHNVTEVLASAVWSGGATLPPSLATLVQTGFSASLPADSTGTGSGTIDWAFSASGAEVEFLSEGETLRLVYNVTVTDNQGTSHTQPVAINFIGTNDAPRIESAIHVGTISEALDSSTGELGNVTDQVSGDIAFADLDLYDTHSAAQAFTGAVWHQQNGHTEVLSGDLGKLTLTAPRRRSKECWLDLQHRGQCS